MICLLKRCFAQKESSTGRIKNSDYEQESDSNVNSPKNLMQKVINASSKDKFERKKIYLQKQKTWFNRWKFTCDNSLALFIYYKTAPM